MICDDLRPENIITKINKLLEKNVLFENWQKLAECTHFPFNMALDQLCKYFIFLGWCQPTEHSFQKHVYKVILLGGIWDQPKKVGASIWQPKGAHFVHPPFLWSLTPHYL